jgi:nitroreductase
MLKTDRISEYPIHELILNRWSARAFSNEPVSPDELFTIFDAARWAQNSYNNQPWRFIYASKNSDAWPLFLSFLVPANRIWAQKAQVLILLVSKKTFDFNGKPSKTHSFDTGAAAQNMALQAAFMNIIVHGLEGFDYQKAQKDCNVPEDYQIEAMFAIGKLGDKNELPEDLAAREKPSGRKPLHEVIFENVFKTI